MKLLVRFLLSFCCLLLGVHTHTSQEGRHGFPRHFYTLSGEDVDNLQAGQAYVSQRRSTGDQRINDEESAEKEEESDDEDDDDNETKSFKRHSGPGSNYLTSSSSTEPGNSLYLLSHFPSREHLSYGSSSKFIIHCVFRI